jgi:hypothetical protein
MYVPHQRLRHSVATLEMIIEAAAYDFDSQSDSFLMRVNRA